ncbi:M16 family metallopeptidase [Spirulina subsalsa]|uniref:M16 family metallopeptidase n=1 Tax=Spirulina subsalsa TaxID=54311 RepID=UPI000474D20E
MERQQTASRPVQWLKVLSGLFALLIIWTGTITPALAQNQAQSIQPYLDRVLNQVTEFSLENGMKFIVLERHDAPVVSFVTYADVGSTDEPEGKTGLAHYLEHLAFKGTKRIGTRDYEKEAVLLDQLDDLFEQLKTAKAAGETEKVAQLQADFDQIHAQAKDVAIQNQFGQIVEKEGGVGLNAATSADYTVYFYSFPSNKLELWMSLESERFLEPVFREFFEEKEVILEERRLGVDNSPIGQMVEAFLGEAFTTHPYQHPVIGYEDDLRDMRRDDIQAFFDLYYVPNNLTVAIVGDVNPNQVQQLAEVYFGRYPNQPQPPEMTLVEPPQQETREVTLTLESQPWYLEGFHRPAITDRDHAVYQIMTSILSDGRTSRLYRSLVEEKQVALNAQGFNGFPGDKYPNLLLFYALTAPDHTVEDVATALEVEIERMKREPVTQQELDRAKTQARAGLLRSLDSNMGMAQLLVSYQVKTGNWRNLFQQIERISAVTAADVQRVARKTFTANNKTIGRLLSANNN